MFIFPIRCWTFDVRCSMFIFFHEQPFFQVIYTFLHLFPFSVRCSSFPFDVGRSMFDVHLFPRATFLPDHIYVSSSFPIQRWMFIFPIRCSMFDVRCSMFIFFHEQPFFQVIYTFLHFSPFNVGCSSFPFDVRCWTFDVRCSSVFSSDFSPRTG